MKTFVQYLKEQEGVTSNCSQLVPKLGSAIRQFKDLHWNVRGEGFLEIHELFGEVYDSLNGFQDRIAERARGMGMEVTTQTPEIKTLRFEVEEATQDAIGILREIKVNVAKMESDSDDVTVKNILGELSEAIDAFLYKLTSSVE